MEIIGIATESLITPYKETHQSVESKDVKNMEKRYVWFTRALKEFKKKSEDLFPHYWGVQCFILNEFCVETSLQVTEMLSKMGGSEHQVIDLIKALQATIKFEGVAYDDLKSEYEQYISLKKEEENPHRISIIPNIKGSISKCFERFTGPYIAKEEKDLRKAVLSELRRDLEKKDKWVVGSEDLNLLGSSMVMFNNIKFLLERGSKISRGKTMMEVQGLIRRVIGEYLSQLQAQILKEEMYWKKDENFENKFLLNICVLVNTLDYIKETLSKMNDIVKNLIDEPYSQTVSFSAEEDRSVRIISLSLDAQVRLYSKKLDLILEKSMLKKQWDKIDNVILSSNYINDIKQVMVWFCGQVRGNVATVYVLRCFKQIAETTNTRFLGAVYKIRRINEYSVQQLHIDFIELKAQLHKNGVDQHNQLISSIYPSLIDKFLEKTNNVIKLLDIKYELIEDTVRDYLGDITASELNKILALKGIKKSQANAIIIRLGK